MATVIFCHSGSYNRKMMLEQLQFTSKILFWQIRRICGGLQTLNNFAGTAAAGRMQPCDAANNSTTSNTSFEFSFSRGAVGRHWSLLLLNNRDTANDSFQNFTIQK